MKFKLLLMIIFLTGCKSRTLEVGEIIQISDVRIYLDFNERGYSTIGALSHFKDLNTNRIKTVNLLSEDIKKIESIMNVAKITKHKQTKLGENIVFCEIKHSESDVFDRLIITQVGSVYSVFGGKREERAFITNLSKMIDYKVTKKSDLIWLKEFSRHLRSTPSSPKYKLKG